MQLVYRGVSYPVSNTTVNSVKTYSGKTYRGQSYTRRCPIAIAEPSQRMLTYRGIAYTTEQQIHNPFI